MANTFKNSISGSIGPTETIVYTTPSSATTTVIGISVANIGASNTYINVKVYDNSDSINAYLIKDALTPPGSNLVLVGGEQKVVLEPNDYLTLESTEPSSADVIVSVLEIS